MPLSWQRSKLLFSVALQIAFNVYLFPVQGLVSSQQRYSYCSSSNLGKILSGSQLHASEPPDFHPITISNSYRNEAKSSLFAFVSAVALFNTVKSASASSVTALRSDEFEVTIRETFLGLGLTELEYGDQKYIRVCVQSVKENANKDILELVKPGMILVAVDGKNIEGQSRSEVIEAIKLAPRPMTLLFRNREMFFQKLNSTSTDVSMISSGTGNLIIETAISSAPGDLLRVERLEKGSGICIRSAAIGDVVEVSYQVRIKGANGINEEIIDGAQNIASQGSRPSDENLYFVMTPSSTASSSSSSAGTALPMGWDASMRGMCVGERRLISLPASLAFGKQGMTFKKAGTGSKEGTVVLPPDTSIIIDVRLLSLNGVA